MPDPVLLEDHFKVTILGFPGGVNVSVVDSEGFSGGTHGQRITEIFLENTFDARLSQIEGWGSYSLNDRALRGINSQGYIKHALENDGGIFWSATDESPFYSQATASQWLIEDNRAFYKSAKEFANWMRYQNTLFIASLENTSTVSSGSRRVPAYCDDFPGQWGWIPLCGAISDYIAHTGIGIENTIFVGAIDRRSVDVGIAAIRADGVYAPHTIYVESKDGSTSQATPVLAAYATNLAFANPTWGAARLKQELMALSREEVIDYQTGATDSLGSVLLEKRAIKAIRPEFAPEPYSHRIAIMEQGLSGDEPTVVEEIFHEDALTYSDQTHQHNGVAFNDDGVLDRAGGNIVPLPFYLVGSPYYRFADNAGDNAGYVGQLTSDVECYWYLLIDNRLDGPNSDLKPGNSNTEDAILGGALQWVIDDGWQRVNTGISPNGQADYTGLDEAGDAEGPGLGLNQFYGVWVLPDPSTSVTVNSNGISGSNMISVVASRLPPPPTNLTYSVYSAVYTPGVAITPIIPSTRGGEVVSYSITPALPQGLVLDGATGVISGVPSGRSLKTAYTVTARNSGGWATAVVTITVFDGEISDPVLEEDHFEVTILGFPGGVNVSVVDSEGFSGGTHGQRITEIFLENTFHARLSQIEGWGNYSLNDRALNGINSQGYIKHALENDGGIFWSATDESPFYSQATASQWLIEDNRAFYKSAKEFANWMQYQNTLFIASLENTSAVSSGSRLVPAYCDDFPGQWGWIPLCGAISDYIAHTGIGIENTIFVGAIDRRSVDVGIAAIRADGVYAPHTIYVESKDGSTSQATPVLAAYATNLAFANPTWGAARLKQELMALSREEVIDYQTGATDSLGSVLLEKRAIKAIRPEFAPEPYSHRIAIMEQGLSGDEPTVVEEIFHEDALTYSDQTHQHNGVAFNDDGVLDRAGGNIVPLPFYLVGSPYYRFADNAGDNAGYVGQLTSDVECYWYLLIDNRLDGPNSDLKPGNSNTEEAILGGALQWVIDGGWQRVNTGISPNGQADYTGLDEAGDAEGPGLGLNQFFGVWVLPDPSTSAAVNSNSISGSNMISVVASQLPPPPTNLTYSIDLAEYNQGVAITDIIPSTTGGEVASYSITPTLPQGLVLDRATGVISGTPNAGSQRTEYTVTAMNKSGMAMAVVTITVFGNVVQDWRRAHFSAADLGDQNKESSVWGNAANPDGDHWVNALEFFFGRDPNRVDVDSPISYKFEEGVMGRYAVLEFERSKAAPAGAGVVQVSGDLSQWQTVSAETIELVENMEDRERVRVWIFIDQQAKRRFLRLGLDL